MKRFASYLILGLLLAGCCPETGFEPDTPVVPSDEAVITICGGRPSAGATRAVNPPALPGVCQADKIKIWAYSNETTKTTYWKSISDLTTIEDVATLDIVNTKQNNGSIDRWIKTNYSHTFPRTGCTYFAMPALAFSSSDESKFTVSKGANYTAISLTLSNTSKPTPELFYGHTRFWPQGKLESYFGSTDGIDYWNNSGYFCYDNTTIPSIGGPDNFTLPLSGHLYRIVSQINVNMTEVPTELVDHLELYMTNVPKTISLYGTHGNVYSSDNTANNPDDIGRFYPVTAVTSASNCIDGQTLVATTNVFTNDEAHMSAFFLPSEVGGELTLRVYYKPHAMKDAMGNDITQRDYPIHPGKSAFLTGDDADVYNVGAALQNGSDLYVYNTTLNKFYSYANVRVNISGKYDNVAAEDQDVTLTIEVEPGYERGHTININ